MGIAPTGAWPSVFGNMRGNRKASGYNRIIFAEPGTVRKMVCSSCLAAIGASVPLRAFAGRNLPKLFKKKVQM
jgi:hypothetical protein